jgi:ATP-dependent Lon protease
MTSMSDSSIRVWPGPMPLQVMMHGQWNWSFDFAFKVTAPISKGFLAEGWLARTKASDDHGVTRAAINDLIEVLFERKQVHLALAWQFLAADAAKPETIQSFLPQVSSLFSKAIDDDVYSDEEAEAVRETMNVWMDAAGGHFIDAKVSLFAVAAKLIRGTVSDKSFNALRKKATQELAAEGDDEEPGHGLVVMPKHLSSKLVDGNGVFKEVIGKRLPFTVASDVFQVQAQLRREYPHAWAAISLLTKDLRDGKPVRIAPVVLVGDPGSGKSRLARRLSELLGYESVYRFDASGISDAVAFSGTSRGWGNTTPSVPARAVQQAGKANPWVLVDEIDKAGTGMHNGNFYGSITPFLERESSRRYRDISLDAELDLSFVSYIATANDDTKIPSHIRDRFRIIRVPLPGLQHLRPLALGIMADLAAENDVDPRFMAPLDLDEELVIAKAWARVGFSIRKLQKIIAATQEARDAVAMRN